MENLIRTYALIKSLYDEGEDYIDSFWPFTIQVLDENKYFDTTYIQGKVLDTCGLNIPLHVLGTILKRARKRGYLEYKFEMSKDKTFESYKLAKKGSKYIDTLEKQEDVQRRINDLLSDIAVFFREREITIENNKILDLLLSVLNENSQPLREFLNPSDDSLSGYKPLQSDQNIKVLIDYLKISEHERPDKYQTIQDILFGSIISTAISTGEQYDIHDLLTRKFKRCRVYLDTNFVLSLLTLRPAGEIVEGAKELFQLIQKYHCPIRVFDFTVGEITRVLSLYFTDEYRYSNSVTVDNVCGYFKRNGWTKTQLREYIANIELTLKSIGIEVELKRNINLKTYTPKDQELRSRLMVYKKEQGLLPQNHDLAAIEVIRDMRRYDVRQIEFANAIFLTSDTGLSRFDYIEMGHKDDNTIGEVILDRLLTNILWLKMPNSKPTLKSIIASHSRNLFIKGKVWNKFYDVLSKIKQDGEVKDENISMLFYHGYIEETLSHFEDYQIDGITKDFVLDEIVKASKLYERDVKRKIGEKEKEFLKRLSIVVSKVEYDKSLEKDQEWINKISELKDNIQASAEKSAKKITRWLRILTLIVFAIPFIVIILTMGWHEFLDVIPIVTLLLFIIVITGVSIGSLWKLVELKLENKLYFKRIIEAGLNKY